MTVVSDLEGLLAEEQELLLSGKISALEGLITRKAELAERLAEAKPDLPKEIYQGLARKAAQNEALLGAAQRGLQAAMAQLKQLSEGEQQKTYSKEGMRQSLCAKPVSITQKI